MSNFFRFLTSKTFLINLIIALILFSSALYGTMKYLENYTLHGKTIKVPDLIERNLSEVDSLLSTTENFSKVVADSLYRSGVKGGTILEQNPPPNTTVKYGRKIYLTIAAYEPPKISMPDLVDMSLRQATSLMETFGLEVGELTYQSDLCVNCILEQKMHGEVIAPGRRINRGSTIDLVVGQGLGDELTSVPYLIELRLDLAKDLLKSKSLNVGSILYDQTVLSAEDTLKAKVYKQIPFYQSEPTVRMGSTVDLFLTVDTNRIIHSVNPRDSLN